MGLVPQESCGLLRDMLDGPVGIVVAIRSRKNDDAEFHKGAYVEDNMEVAQDDITRISYLCFLS